jgi:hypothetical protein
MTNKPQQRPSFRCLYNHELLILFTTESPYQSYREDVTRKQVEGYVRELKGTQVDALMCCPTAWKTPLYVSEVDRKWQDEAPSEVEPLHDGDMRYAEKVYWRVRRYMLQGNDPVALSLNAAREIGLGFFLSYRMNDHHYNTLRDLRVHSRFWREHPEFAIRPEAVLGPGDTSDLQLNYRHPEVRDYYRRILFELVDSYDIDGLELDFMRTGRYFPDEEIEAGRTVMTDFVRTIREKLVDVGQRRGRALQLCVRVPRTVELARGIGLDVPGWATQGLIDMVNVSPHFRNSLDLDIEGYKQAVPGGRVYGEMHFVTDAGRLASGFSNNINRRTTPTQYETAALSFWDQGADGVSFFNFAYTRHHYFGEPRRSQLPGIEPPFQVLERICDADYLRGRPKHYRKNPAIPAISNEVGRVPVAIPARGNALITVHVADQFDAGHPFARAVLRLESRDEIIGFPLSVLLNGRPLTETYGLGELFAPLSAEAIPHYENLRFFEVPLDCLAHGLNRVVIHSHSTKGHTLRIHAVDLALYVSSSEPIRRKPNTHTGGNQ